MHHWLCRIVVLYSSCIIFWGQVNQTSREINPMFSRSANHQFREAMVRTQPHEHRWRFGYRLESLLRCMARFLWLESRVPWQCATTEKDDQELMDLPVFGALNGKEGSMRFTCKPDYPADERGPVQMKIMKHCDQRV